MQHTLPIVLSSVSIYTKYVKKNGRLSIKYDKAQITLKSTKNLLPNFGFIEEIIDLSRILLAVKRLKSRARNGICFDYFVS